MPWNILYLPLMETYVMFYSEFSLPSHIEKPVYAVTRFVVDMEKEFWEFLFSFLTRSNYQNYDLVIAQNKSIWRNTNIGFVILDDALSLRALKPIRVESPKGIMI